MDTAVPVLERVNEHESKRDDRSGDDGIDLVAQDAIGQGGPGVHEACDVLRPRADEMDLFPISADRLADEVLKIAPVRGGIAGIDDTALELDQGGLVGVNSGAAFNAATKRSVRLAFGVSPSMANEERVSFVNR